MEDESKSLELDPQMLSGQLNLAIGQIEFSRAYVLELLDATPRELWFDIPTGSASSVAWQVGHLTVSQYGLLLFRQRGRHEDDLELVPGTFRKKYGRGSTPVFDKYGDPVSEADRLLERMRTVYDRALSELRAADPARLLESIDMPYAVYPNKLGAVLFCPLHEQLHAGQIGALRRSLGLEPVR